LLAAAGHGANDIDELVCQTDATMLVAVPTDGIADDLGGGPARAAGEFLQLLF
jgi:hypothetical protein